MKLPELKYVNKESIYRLIFEAVPQKELTQAQAEEVLRRCEAHGDLLAACEAAQTMLLQTFWRGDSRMDIVHNVIARAKKTKAEEGVENK